MKWKEFLRDYFIFTRRERIGLLVVVFVAIGIWIFPKVSRPSRPKTVPLDTGWITAAKELMIGIGDSSDQQNNADQVNSLPYNEPLPPLPNDSNAQPFYFDPNILSFEGWKKLGMREKTILTIQNYLHKGGHFYKPADLRKIYGVHPDEYIRLEPYIKIASPSPTEATAGKKTESMGEGFSGKAKYEAVDINTADTSALIALPGIGNKLAVRIVNFRDKLGGFYTVDQIGETYGLADSTFQKIKPLLKLETNLVKKININTATKDEMKLHPYLKWSLANAIVEYRNQHGNFSSLEDLKKITLITDEVFDKIKSYVTL
jgi:competence protein ComEA